MLRSLAAGALAGAAGTTALNAATYVDMAVRGRPASSTPQQSVEELADRAGVDIPGEGDTRDNRLSGLGPLTGILTGVGVGALYGAAAGVLGKPNVLLGGLFAGAAAMAGADAPMTALGLTDPRSWDRASWLSDALPHAAYGLVVALTYRLASSDE